MLRLDDPRTPSTSSSSPRLLRRRPPSIQLCSSEALPQHAIRHTGADQGHQHQAENLVHWKSMRKSWEIMGNLYSESTIESGFDGICLMFDSNKYDIPISIPQFFLFLFPFRFPSSLDSPLLADIPLGQSKCADSANRGGVSRPK